MRVRRGRPADRPRALEIWRSAVDATHGFLSVAHRSEIHHIVAEEYLPSAELCVATDDLDLPMGFLAMGSGSIDALFVDGAAHGQGYGTLLVDHALSIESNLKVDANEQASNAVAFYLKRGFRIMGRSDTDGDGRPYPLIQMAR